MRIVRRLTHVLIIVLTLVVGAAAAAVIVSQTAWFKNWLRGYIVAQANQYMNGTLSIERLGGNLFFGVELENIGVSMDGSQVVAVKDLGVDYNLFALISKGLSVDSIRIDKPVIYLRREGDIWQLSRLVKRQETEADREGPTRPVSIDAIELTDGSVVVDQPVATSGVAVPKRFDHLDAKLSFKYEPVRYSIEITQVSFRGSEPAIAVNALSGGVSVRDDTVFVEKLALRTAQSTLSVEGAVQQYLSKPQLNLQITSDKLSLPEIARLVPALAGIPLQPAFEIKLNGPMDRLGVDMNVRSDAGQVTGQVVADILSPGQSVAGRLSVRHLDLAPLLKDPQQKSDLTADLQLDVRGESLSDPNGLHGNVALDSQRIVAAGYTAGPVHAKARIDGRKIDLDGRASAYGATATVAGNLMLPDTAKGAAAPIVFDLRGQARGIDLRKLPRELQVPPLESNVNADYHVAGAVATGDHPTRNLNGDARFLQSTVAGAAIAGGSTAGFTMNGSAIGYSADANVSELDLERFGREFKIAALATDRYASRINGHIVANGHGTTPKEIDVTAHGTFVDTTILGGTIPQLDFDGSMARDTAHLKATGSFSGFDPAVASGKKELQGTVGGTLAIDATVANVSGGVTPESVQADAKIVLEPSTVGGLEMTRANLDGTYRDSTGDIRTLEIVGRDINVQASGMLALNDSGQSNLELHADSPSLETLGKLVNVPLTGIAKIDATITGNKSELQAAGNLTGNGVKYEENGALTISADYTAKVRDLDVANAKVAAKTHATFVTVAGQDINELDATTTYEQKRLEFEATAKQPQRSLGATGAVVLHPDHQEIHLAKLGLETQGQTWQLASGSEATIKYGGDAINVAGLTLANGDQQMSADGAFGGPGDSLKVSLTNVDLATVDALMLRPPQLSGRLNATGNVTGTKAAPAVKTDFEISQGGFQQYKYDSFGGTVNYDGAGLTLDTKLQQNPTTYLTAKGYVPMALFKGRLDDRASAHGVTAPPAERVDLHIESTPIDLGLVQGFTTALTNVTGTLQAKIDVTGSAADPHPLGTVKIDNAAFTVDQTGVSYRNLRGTIDLQQDKVHIEHISVLDNHDSSLSITGDLAVHELQVGGVELYVTANDFKVIDNKMGNVRVTSDLQIAGELRAPLVKGDFAIETGRVNLDPILALVGDSAYSTEPTDYLATTAAAGPSGEEARSGFDALKMDVRVTVPDDLVVKASELRAPGAAISLGAMNITLGGDIRATKEPGHAIVLVGAINTVRGNYDFQGRRFEILRDGSVRFDNQPLSDMDPRLDIRTRRLIQGVEARVNVAGTLKQPEIKLSSVPPLEEGDILSLIVFNQPLNALGEGQQISLAQRAQQMATGAVAGQIAQSIGNAIGVDTFEINTAPENGGAASLTIGQQVGQNLYVKVEQGIGDQSSTNFILEYELTRWLRLRTNVLQGSNTTQSLFQRAQGSGADLLFFFSY